MEPSLAISTRRGEWRQFLQVKFDVFVVIALGDSVCLEVPFKFNNNSIRKNLPICSPLYLVMHLSYLFKEKDQCGVCCQRS